MDIFHALRDLGREVRSVEQAEIRRLSKLFELERRIQSAKTRLPAKQEYDLTRQNTPLRLLQSDSLLPRQQSGRKRQRSSPGFHERQTRRSRVATSFISDVS